jgi:hypothetical protein
MGPRKSASRSVAGSGVVNARPEKVVSVVTKDRDGEPTGFFEAWSDSAWIYAEKDALRDTN